MNESAQFWKMCCPSRISLKNQWKINENALAKTWETSVTFRRKRWNTQRNERKSAERNLGLPASNSVEKALGIQRNHIEQEK